MADRDNTQQERRWEDENTVTELPSLRHALERRYPGVRITCCQHRRRHEDGREGITCGYSAPLDTLVRYGLATVVFDRSGKAELVSPFKEFEITGSGAAYTGKPAYIYLHCYDSDPVMPGERQYPPKGVEKEVARIWRRITRSVKVRP